MALVYGIVRFAKKGGLVVDMICFSVKNAMVHYNVLNMV
jgi:hypothetical protein